MPILQMGMKGSGKLSNQLRCRASIWIPSPEDYPPPCHLFHFRGPMEIRAPCGKHCPSPWAGLWCCLQTKWPSSWLEYGDPEFVATPWTMKECVCPPTQSPDLSLSSELGCPRLWGDTRGGSVSSLPWVGLYQDSCHPTIILYPPLW